ncbi:hypothetical protein [Streptomyces sp. LN325]|uniref:hypothetical protein n=1 Tax=Streptomyces sp. LN325 TaxID=3112976 RepID=UPI00371EC02E
MSNAIAVIAILISIGALVYSHLQAAYSRRQLKLGERVRQEAAEPYVVADIQPRAGGSGLLVFTVENIGPTVARDVELSVTPPSRGASEATGMRRLLGLSHARFPTCRRAGVWSGTSPSAHATSRRPISHGSTRSRSDRRALKDLSSL